MGALPRPVGAAALNFKRDRSRSGPGIYLYVDTYILIGEVVGGLRGWAGGRVGSASRVESADPGSPSVNFSVRMTYLEISVLH